MGTNLHVQLTYDEKAKRFDCRNRLDEVIASLLNGDVFTLDHLNTTVQEQLNFHQSVNHMVFILNQMMDN